MAHDNKKRAHRLSSWLLWALVTLTLAACGAGGSGGASTPATNPTQSEQEASGNLCTASDSGSDTTLTVTFDPNGGSLDRRTLEVCSEGVYPDLPTPSRAGFTFTNWEHDGEPVQSDDPVAVKADHTLRAAWSANILDVTFFAGFGTFPTSGNREVTIKRPVGAAIKTGDVEIPQIDGGAFLHWRYADGSTVSTTDTVGEESLTLFAVYDVEVTVTIDLAGGTWPEGEDPDMIPSETGSQIVVRLGEVYDNQRTFGTPVREGFVFEWWTIHDPDGQEYLADIRPEREPVAFRETHNLAATWIRQHELSFNANAPSARAAGVTGVPAEALTITERSHYPALPQPSLPGYSFGGWYEEGLGEGAVQGDEIIGQDDPADRSATRVPDSSFEGETPVTTVYARWTANEIEVTFDDNYPSGGTTTETATVDSTYNLPSIPERTGYTFAHWRENADESGSFIDETTGVSNTEDHTVYAQWEPNTYSVSYQSGVEGLKFEEAGGPIDDVMIEQVEFDSAYPTLVELGITLERPGYVLEGWRIDGGDVVTSLPNTMTIAADHDVEAVWAKADLTVGVCTTLGGCQEGDFVDYLEHVGSWYSKFILEQITDPSGDYWHTGWTYYPTENPGFAQDILETNPTRDNVLLPDDHRIEPIWQERHALTLDGNHPNLSLGSSVLLPSGTYRVAQGEPYGDIPSASLEGYTFQGWGLTPTTTDVISSTAQSTMDAPHTLYAVWLGNGVNVTFDPNPFAPDDETVTNQIFGGAYSTTGVTTPTQAGFTFDGWHLDDDGADPLSGPQVIDATGSAVASVFVSNPDPHTVYAKWTPNEYNVTIDLQGGSWPSGGGPNDENPSTPETDIVRLFTDAYNRDGAIPDPERTGYVFQFWSVVQLDGSHIVDEVLPSSPLWYPGDHKLVAQWGKQHDVALDGNAPAGRSTTVSPSTVTVTEGMTVPALPTPDVAGYTFSGWYPSQGNVNDANERIQGEDDPQPTGVPLWEQNGGTPWTTLYAGWTANTVTVTYDDNHDAGGTTTLNVTVDGAYDHPDDPSNRPNYTFAGWNTAGDGSGQSVANASSVTATDHHTLYAQWTYDGQNAAWVGGTAASAPASSFTLDGVTFTVTSTTEGSAGNGTGVALVNALQTPDPGGTSLDATTPAAALHDGNTVTTYARFGTATPTDVKAAIESLTDAGGNPLYAVEIAGSDGSALPSNGVTIDGGVTEFIIDPEGPNNAVLVRAFDHGSTTYQNSFISIENKVAPESPSFQAEVGTSGALDVELPYNAANTAQTLIDTINGATQTADHLDHWTAELTTDSDNPDGVANDGSGVMPGAPYQHEHTVQSMPIRAHQNGFFGGTPFNRTFADSYALRAFPTDGVSAGVSAVEFDAAAVAYRVWATGHSSLSDGTWSWYPTTQDDPSYSINSAAGRTDDFRDLIGGRGTDDSQSWLPLEDATFEAMTEGERDTYVSNTDAGGDRIQNAGALIYAKLPQSAHENFSSAVKTEEGVAGTQHAAFSSSSYPLELLGEQSMILRQTPGSSESERYFFGVNVANSSGTAYAYDLNYTSASYTVDPEGDDNAFVVVIDDASVDTTLPLRIEYAHKTAGDAIVAAFTPDDGGVNRLRLEFSHRGDSVDEIVPVIHDLAALDAYLADGSTGTGKIGFGQNINGTYTPSTGTLQLPTTVGLADVTVSGIGTATVTLDGSLTTSNPQLAAQGGTSNHVLRYQPNTALSGFITALETGSSWSTLSNVTATTPGSSSGAAVMADAEATLEGGTDFDPDQTSLSLESGTLNARSSITVTGKALRVEAGSSAAITNDANGILLTVVPGDTTVNDLKALASFDANLESLSLTSAGAPNDDAPLVKR